MLQAKLIVLLHLYPNSAGGCLGFAVLAVPNFFFKFHMALADNIIAAEGQQSSSILCIDHPGCRSVISTECRTPQMVCKQVDLRQYLRSADSDVRSTSRSHCCSLARSFFHTPVNLEHSSVYSALDCSNPSRLQEGGAPTT